MSAAAGARLDGRAFLAWLSEGRRVLARRRQELDRVNVFPVHDRDTGTNLVATWAAAGARATSDGGSSVGDVARSAARGALLGASGTGGALLASLLGGFASSAAGADSLDGESLLLALAGAAGASRDAAPDHGPGGLVWVAGSVGGVAWSPDAATVAARAATAAGDALRATATLNPVLGEAGLVDAGGLGWTVLLEALAEVLGRWDAAGGAGP